MRRIAASLLSALVLTGCAAPPASSSAPAPAAQAENMSSSMVESSSRPMPEAEVLEAYERAWRVYAWFDLSPLPVSDESFFVEGETYYRVNMQGIQTLESLRTYLRGVFSQELTDRLLDGRSARIQYRDVNGVLCTAGSGREQDPGKGQIQVEAEQLSDDLYSVNVLVDLLDEDGKTVVGLESWSFPYAFVEDRWVFTDFRLVY